MVHELCYAVQTITNTFLELRSNKSDGFGLVETQASCKALLRERASLMLMFSQRSMSISTYLT